MEQRLANSWRMTVNEKKFIETALLADLRVDGHRPFDYRRLSIKFGSKDGSSEVQLGQTHVMGYVTSQLVQPYRDRPNEGTLSIFTEFSPMADPTFEAGRPGESAIELGRVIDRGLRESRAVDMESLCVVAGKSVWAIRVDLHILDNGGNLIDAANIAALAALLTFRRPECTLGGENGQDIIVHEPEVREPLPLIIHHLPVAVTFAFFGEGNIMVIDPTHKEEAVMGGRMTATLNSNGDVCAVQKAGGEGVMSSVVMQCLRIASVKAADITSKIKNSVEAYNTERALRKVKRHSSSVAQIVSVPDAIMKENQVNELTRHQAQMLKDEPERSCSSVGDGIVDEFALSHKRDGNSIGKTFIGGPSNWDPYSKGISTSFIKTSQVEAYNTERALRKVKRHSSSVAQIVSVPDAIMKENQVNELTRHQAQMLKDEPERSCSSVGDGIVDEFALSHKRDGNSIGKTFIGGPSNWDPYSKGISTSFIKTSQVSLGPSTMNKEQEARNIQKPIESNPKGTEILNASSSGPVVGSGVSQQTNSPKSLKDAVKLKNKKKNTASSSSDANLIR